MTVASVERCLIQEMEQSLASSLTLCMLIMTIDFGYPIETC